MLATGWRAAWERWQEGLTIKPTLAETEDYLKRSLAEDPLRIGRHPEVRGVGEGWESYDDRAYLRFSLI